ncbi:MAG: hypothetical protein MSJ26_01735 [Oscillospiraceae bacterium]|nr:hypothetical protein [Oscillospiraceae bacterium]
MDKIRRAIFTVSAEGASLFEWAIWATILTVLVGLPLAIAVLQSFLGIIVTVITGAALFVLTFIFLGITDFILSFWPFEISDEELQFEKDYIPRIPND